MSTIKWKIDGNNVIPAEQQKINWEDNRFFTVEWNGKTFFGEVTEEKMEEGFIKVKINHREFLLEKEGKLDSLIKELGLDKEKIKKLKQLKSPMPGRVIGVSVQPGDNVVVGDELLTLEAMKMENVLKSDGEGIVKSIDVSLQDVVEKGKVLITFE
jgi:acetyl/propionyl-CoA carboxylase alpha subunit